jgi:hypothetical protein
MYQCRECEHEINQATEICPHCGTDLTLDAQPAAEPARKRSLAATLIQYGVLLAAIWGFLWFVLPERRSSEARAVAEAQAIAALQETARALAAYAAAQGEVYPGSLDALPQESAVAVREAARAAQREGYRLEYAVRAGGEDQAARHFTLLARPSRYGYRNFFLDETGVIRATRENRPATAQDPPI